MNDQNKYIINSPELKSPLRHGTEFTITFIAWTVWVYLLMPLLTFLMWVVGIKSVFVKQFMLDSIDGLISVSFYYIAVIVIIGLVFMLWNLFNRRLHGGEDRRKHADPVASEELSKFFNIKEEDIALGKTARHVSVSFDNDKITLSAELGTTDN